MHTKILGGPSNRVGPVQCTPSKSGTDSITGVFQKVELCSPLLRAEEL